MFYLWVVVCFYNVVLMVLVLLHLCLLSLNYKDVSHVSYIFDYCLLNDYSDVIGIRLSLKI